MNWEHKITDKIKKMSVELQYKVEDGWGFYVFILSNYKIREILER